jgi:ribonuclease R
VGRRRRRRYSLGDQVLIRVERANLDRKQLDFSLVEE